MEQTQSFTYLKLKLFLYKLLPTFKATNKNSKVLFEVDRYTTTLSEEDFLMFDLTPFISNYSVDQGLEQSTYNWSITLQDRILSFDELQNPKDGVFVAGKKPIRSAEDLARLAYYDAASKTIDGEVANYKQPALKGRGEGQSTFIIGTTGLTGVRLSDLLQKYNMVSLFVYKDNTPLEEIRGTITYPSNFAEENNRPVFVPDADGLGSPLTSDNLQSETVLLSPNTLKVPDPRTNTLPTLFSNVLNGYILRKMTASTAGSVDTVTIIGNGVTRLFGATRRIIKQSAMMENLYDVAQMDVPKQFTPFQNVYVGQTIEKIFADLFNFAYRIKFSQAKSSEAVSVAAVDPNTGDVVASGMTANVYQPTSNNLYDLTAYIVGNELQTNIFSVPPFLLGLVMKRRGYNYREPIDAVAVTTLISSVQEAAANKDGALVQRTLDGAGNAAHQVTFNTGKSPVVFDTNLNVLRPYLKMIEDVLKDFDAELKTPFEIIEEIKSKTFLEFFEKRDGQIVIREPKYNDIATTVMSSALDIVSTQYVEAAENLVSRHKVGHGMDLLGPIPVIREYSYTDGKLLLQFGFMEAGTDINPNVQLPVNNAQLQNRLSALGKYAEYFLRTHNAALQVGVITCAYDPRIELGTTFYDEKNFKYGYITAVSEAVQVGQTALTTFGLSYVRDAVFAEGQERTSPNLLFQELVRLTDLANEFHT